jgi:hypothetical protein
MGARTAHTPRREGVRWGMELFLSALSFVLFVGFVFWRADRMLRKWAASNGLEIVEKKERTHRALELSVFRGGLGRPVYLVTVRDKTGSVRRAWVACGSWFWGVMSLSSDVQVAWLKGMEDDALLAIDHQDWSCHS